MIGARQYFEHLAHHLLLALDRLIGVGIGADCDGFGGIARRRQFALEEAGRVDFCKQPCLEIEARGQAEIGVGGACETIDAAMLATAIGIDRPVEGNIGRLIPGDDCLGGFARHLRPCWREILGQIPAIVFLGAPLFFEASTRVRQSAAAPPGTSQSTRKGIYFRFPPCCHGPAPPLSCF